MKYYLDPDGGVVSQESMECYLSIPGCDYKDWIEMVEDHDYLGDFTTREQANEVARKIDGVCESWGIDQMSQHELRDSYEDRYLSGELTQDEMNAA